MNLRTLACSLAAFALGIFAARIGIPPAGAQSAGSRSEYNVLQDRDLWAEVASPRKEELQVKLNRLGNGGWEPMNPHVVYIQDKGFVVVTGPAPEKLEFPDRRAVLLLRREKR
jgi:hypothetical protein